MSFVRETSEEISLALAKRRYLSQAQLSEKSQPSRLPAATGANVLIPMRECTGEEVWGSKYDVRELLRIVLKKVKGTDIEILLRESGLIE